MSLNFFNILLLLFPMFREISACGLFLKLDITATKGVNYLVKSNDNCAAAQISELLLFQNETLITSFVRKDSTHDNGDNNSRPTSQHTQSLFDGNVNTKWFVGSLPNSGSATIIIPLSATKCVTSYSWVTGNDVVCRDPYNWTISESFDNEHYFIISQVGGFLAPVNRTMNVGNFTTTEILFSPPACRQARSKRSCNSKVYCNWNTRGKSCMNK
jgi:hypothetical protein